MTCSVDRARALLSRFNEQRILVVGDIILDRFVYGVAERISPEAPVPVVKVTRETDVLGGASNVASNIRSLQAAASIGGFMGADRSGKTLKRLFQDAGIGMDSVMEDARVPTTVKTRVVADRQQVVRVDRDNESAYPDDLMERFESILVQELDRCTGVIIEDYGKGTVCQRVVDTVLKTARAKNIPTAFDPKDNHELDVKGVTVTTPNKKEAFLAAGLNDAALGDEPARDERLLDVGRILVDKWSPELLLITLGPQGMLLLSGHNDPYHVPTRAQEVFDVSGAGDTVIAVCLLALASGSTHEEAADLANAAAGVVVAKLGTASCTQEEIIESLK